MNAIRLKVQITVLTIVTIIQDHTLVRAQMVSKMRMVMVLVVDKLKNAKKWLVHAIQMPHALIQLVHMFVHVLKVMILLMELPKPIKSVSISTNVPLILILVVQMLPVLILMVVSPVCVTLDGRVQGK